MGKLLEFKPKAVEPEVVGEDGGKAEPTVEDVAKVFRNLFTQEEIRILKNELDAVAIEEDTPQGSV